MHLADDPGLESCGSPMGAERGCADRAAAARSDASAPANAWRPALNRPRDVTAVAERIRLHRVSRTFGYADVRLPAVNLCGLKIEEQPDGSLRIRPPETVDAQGRRWPCFSLQPIYREQIEREIATLWAASA